MRDISEGKGAEEERRLLITAVEQAAEGVVITDLAAHILYVNPAFTKMTGYAADEVLGRTPSLLKSGKQSSAFYRNLWATILAGNIWRREIVNRRKDGSLYTEEMSITPVRDPLGAITNFIAIKQDITERKRAEEALYRSHLFLAQPEQLAHVGAWEVRISNKDDLDENPLHWSDETYRIFGYEPGSAAVSNEFVFRHVHPEDRPRVRAAFAQAVTDQAPYSIEYRIRRPDRTERTVLERADITLDALGHADGAIGTIQDITELKWAEQAARQTELQYRGLFEHMGEGLAYCRMVFEDDEGLDFIHLTVNNAFQALTGLKDVVGRRVTEVIPGIRETDAGLLETYARVALTGMPEKFEWFLASLQMWLSISAYSPERGFFVAIFDVITERKRAEEEIQRLNDSLERRVAQRTAELEAAVRALEAEAADRKLAESALEKLHRETELILNSAGDGIFRVDLEGKCTFANPAATRMLGYSREELLGQDLHALGRHALPDGTLCTPEKCDFYAALRQGIVHQAADQVLQRKDNLVVPVDSVTTPLLDEGHIAGAVLVLRDVSERRAIEKMKEGFVSVVSHELRTPLTAIRGALGLIGSGKIDGLSPRSRRMVEIAIHNTDRLVRLLSDILDAERLERQEPVLVRKSCTASELMMQAGDLMRALAESTEVRLEIQPQPFPLFVDTDAILQALTNLLSNAIKFSPPRSTVRLGCRREEDYAEFRVTDQGPGIPKDNLETIFGRFQPVDASDSRRRGGTGLGLFICRRIVERHGGKVWAESELGQGSTFVIRLPVEAPCCAT
jgi:PAS domain S-box-containing protein